MDLSVSASDSPLLNDTVDGAVDFQGHPVLRSSSGGWRSASFMIGVEVAERFAYYGIGANLITYLTGPLGQSVATAAESVNIWSGISMLFTLLGAFVADSFFGRYRTILFSSAIYVLGLALLSFSALLPTTTSLLCQNSNEISSCSTPQFQLMLFFVSLYLIGVGQGGHKPCVQAFGADQFDAQHPQEAKSKSSFFNWWFFGVCAGTFVAILVVTYTEENLSWSLGFGIPFIMMVIASVVFVFGKNTYRYSVKKYDKSPFVRIGRVFVSAARNWRASSTFIFGQEESAIDLSQQKAGQFRFLNKACIVPNHSNLCGMVCSMSEVEEAKAVLRIFPVWMTVLVFGIVFAQDSTFFTKQGATMDRSILSGFIIPAAAIDSFVPLSIVIFITIYDRVFVFIARAFTGVQSGITTLQRIGTGLVISAISMLVASMVERKRLRIAEEQGLVDRPDITIPMSFWWLVPQYTLYGLAEVFTLVGLQEFFYDQCPSDLKSMGLAFYTSVLGMGSILSSLLVSVIDEATGANGQNSWFSDNLNKAHLDYFYLLLSGLSLLAFVGFLFVSTWHVYSR
ncbi:protein NRT1/ PTR FAMILY 5.10-like [Cucurbita moschata]|uniref:Protein NRT1/ PTR FAMILY 5.10-like n=1 Tax=Cucurbita moschata TaxID=3662 RepID=A0A6J1GRM0_CUCMO|nr:protein NRT1/ PTR FAMILY 5.10-like [Cucurbita moschata]XP_022954702.1 protein NRT1/ PTR FAMILY 5.10-like [Cucurbita moschata]